MRAKILKVFMLWSLRSCIKIEINTTRLGINPVLTEYLNSRIQQICVENSVYSLRSQGEEKSGQAEVVCPVHGEESG